MPTKYNRRFLLKSALAQGFLPLIDLAGKEPVIEWNAHIFSRDTEKYPFHHDATYKPDASKYPADPLGTYLARLKNDGIDKAVIVHPEPYGDDHRLILDCLKKEPNRLRGTSLFFPRDPKAPEKLESIVKQEPRMIATRFHAHRGKESYLKSFLDDEVLRLWKKCIDLNQFVELHIGPDYAKQVSEVLRKFPQSKVIIDHMAEPQWGSAVEYAEVLELAKYRNVYMKLSGLGHFSEDQPLFKNVMTFTRRVIREFGPDQMIWGSGSPSIVDEHMSEFSEKDRAKVKGGNLNKIIDWNL